MYVIGRRVVFGTALALLAGAGTSSAQPVGGGPRGPGGGPGMGPGGGPGFGRGLNDARSYLAGLKTELGITPAQEAAWAAYSDVVIRSADAMQEAHAGVFGAMQTATWQERRDMMNGMFAARDTVHAQVDDAAQALLPHLTTAQRSKAQASLPGLIARGPGGGQGMGGMGRGGGMGMGGGMGQGRAQP